LVHSKAIPREYLGSSDTLKPIAHEKLTPRPPRYGIDSLTLEQFHGNPTPVNIALAAAGFVVGAVLVVFVWYRGKVADDAQLKEYWDPERQPLIPEEEEM